jgi:hypothetical protein
LAIVGISLKLETSIGGNGASNRRNAARQPWLRLVDGVWAATPRVAALNWPVRTYVELLLAAFENLEVGMQV